MVFTAPKVQPWVILPWVVPEEERRLKAKLFILIRKFYYFTEIILNFLKTKSLVFSSFRKNI